METRVLLFSFILLFYTSKAQEGFISLDCGGKTNYTDEIGLDWTSDDFLTYGETTTISVTNETRKQYRTLRHFPADSSRKYCYTLDVISRTRYLVRATFLYGNFDNNNVYPKFDVSVGATPWSTISISDADTIESIELIFLASSSTVTVCLSNATTGQPFISTLELRQFNGSIYLTPFENQFYLSVSARINFGAENEDPVRYPDDPFDRIWQSDSLKKENYLVDVAVGTVKVSTTEAIDTRIDEMPPQKVMQTAVVGTNGILTYRLNLDGFPAFGWAVTYFAEIEDLASNESRKFRLVLPGYPDVSKAIVNIQENAQGKYRLYEPGYTNLSLPFVLSFRFAKTPDSTRGPLLNAMEINKYLEKNDGSVDTERMTSLAAQYTPADWALEGGDPCLPVPWSWVECNSDVQPSVVKISLSGKNLTGDIPLELTNLNGLVELWLDGNSLTGKIPDFSGCKNLRIIHLENNQLTGELPSSLADLPNLRELYVQNNMLSGHLPSGLLEKSITLNYSGNLNLNGDSKNGTHVGIIIGSSVGAIVLLMVIIASYFYIQRLRSKHPDKEHRSNSLPGQRLTSTFSDAHGEAAHCFTLSEIEDATKSFEKKVGSGGFGDVYYGTMKDGKEIAVKVLASNSHQGKREFSNEVSLLSRIHHRNLVQFLGYCQEEGKSMLIYEFMHNGTLKEHLFGPSVRGRSINWIKRLEIAEDAAKGIEYLHTGCIPAIIHRDIKTSNILLDKHMRANVSDFGLSKTAADEVSRVSSMVRGTFGYLDPEYYMSQLLTEKSDVYSFGIILLELMTGREPISNVEFGANCQNLAQWAKMHIRKGDIQAIIDPALQDEYNIQSMWKIVEKALMCVQPHGYMRPSISEVLKEIQEAIIIEREAATVRDGTSNEMSRNSARSSLNLSLDPGGYDDVLSLDKTIAQPTAR